MRTWEKWPEAELRCQAEKERVQKKNSKSCSFKGSKHWQEHHPWESVEQLVEMKQLFAGILLTMYQKSMQKPKAGTLKSWKLHGDVIWFQKEIGCYGFQSSVYSKLKYESGAHRVQRVPCDRKPRSCPHFNCDSSCYAWSRSRSRYWSKDLRVDIYHASGSTVVRTSIRLRLCRPYRSLPTNIKGVEMQEERTQQKKPWEGHENPVRVFSWPHFRACRMNKTLNVRDYIGTGDRSRVYSYI